MKLNSLHFGKAMSAALFVLLLSVTGMKNALAQSFTVGNLNYSINGDGVSVTVTGHVDGTSAMGSIDIPESVSQGGISYVVTSIGSNAFYNCIGVESFSLPNSLISIGDYAFRGIFGITSISIPDSVTDLGAGAFYDCYNLAIVSLSNSLTSIKSYTFYGCFYLWSFTIPDTVTSIGNYAFYGCNWIEQLTIPNSVTTIGNYAFSNCASLDAVVIGNGVTTIGDYAFYNTGALGDDSYCTFTMGNSVNTIGNYAFSNCAITSIYIPSTVTSIGDHAFHNCNWLNTMVYDASNSNIGSNWLSNCSTFNELTIGEHVQVIPERLIQDPTKLEEIAVVSGNTIFDSRGNCNAVIKSNTNELVLGCKETDIPNTATSIGNYAFSNCIMLTSMDIPNSVNSIGEYAFSNCIMLSSINIPNSVTFVGNHAFEYCSSLTSASLPVSLNTIGDYVFYNTGLTEIIIPNSITSIGDYTFSNCSRLMGINIPNSVTSLGNYAFCNCTSLNSATIGTAVASIGAQAFSGCINLTILYYNAMNCIIQDQDAYGNQDSYGNHHLNWIDGCPLNDVIIGESVQMIPEYFVYGYEYDGTYTHIHNGHSSITMISIPNSVTSIGKLAFGNCTGLLSIIIPYSLDSIAESAFGGCESLSGVYYTGDIAQWCGITFDNVSSNPLYIGENLYLNVNGEWELVESLIVPENVSVIKNYAFYNCTGLTSINWGNSMDSIGYSAFYNCTNLTGTLTIPETVSYVGEMAFRNCSGITTLNYNAPNCNEGIPRGMGFWTNNWLSGCSSLNNVIIGENVQVIPISFVEECTGLTSITIPNTVTSIGNYAFDGCTGLTSITIPENITSIGFGVFENCTSLISLNYNAINCTISNGWLENGSSLTNLIIGENVQVIPCSFVENCTGLTSIVIPNSVTSIGESVFSGCTGLITATIPESVTSMGNRVFYGCTNLTTLTYNAINCTPIVNTGYSFSWFGECSSLINVVIGESVQAIPDYFVKDCIGLTLIIIPDSVMNIGNGAFEGCSNLTSVTIGSSVAFIGNYAFFNCCGLTGELVIPNSVTSIGESAFYNCIGLTSVTIGTSVTSIGKKVFYYCSNLTTLNFNAINCSLVDNTWSDHWLRGCSSLKYLNIGENVQSIPNMFVYNCSGLIEQLVIPDSVTSIGNSAFANCNGATTLTIGNSVTSIESSAFSGCSGLISVVIGNSVNSIGSSVFYSCTGLRNLIVLAEIPPTISNPYYTFYNVDYDIPVSVPCTTEGAYNSAYGWGSFNDIQEDCSGSFEITIEANPSNGGTVNGMGMYQAGTECTLTATANEGYMFSNWSENGEIVSTEATYSFIVSSDRTLVANFAAAGNYWTPENTSSYSLTMALTGIIQLDGIEQYSDQLEVGVFCGDECRGSQIASEFFLTNRYLVMLSIAGEIGDVLTFKLYDHGLAQELNLTSPAPVTFNADGYGTPIEPYALNFISAFEINATVDPEGAGTVTGAGSYTGGTTCTLVADANPGFQFENWTLDGVLVSTNDTYEFTVTQVASYVAHFQYVQTQALSSGWNWYSTYINQEGINGLAMLENSLGSNGVRIQSKSNGYVDQFEYNGTSYWYGTLNAITNEQMYMVRTNTACNAIMTGHTDTFFNFPITINNGWNWIGFPANESVSVSTALSGFTPEANDQIKSKNNGYSTYIVYGNNALWYGTLNTLEPGQGYMYKSNSNASKTLIYQNGRGETLANNITVDGNAFLPKDTDYAYNMTITAVVELDGSELRSENYELAAFVGNECRGSVKLMYVEPFDRYMAFLLVSGDVEGCLHFVLTDGNSASWSEDYLMYNNDETVGTPAEPAVLHFGPLGMNENGQEKVHVYPNPSKDVFNIEGNGMRKVEVINAYGQVICTKEVKSNFVQIDLGNRAGGVYLIRVATDKGITTQQIIKK